MSDHRLRLMLAVSIMAFAVVILRAVQIQGVDAASLSAKAGSQQRGEVTLPGLRGSIISADGQTLAQTQPSKTVQANPNLVKNVSLTAAVIAKAMGFHPYKRAGHHADHGQAKARKGKHSQGHAQRR